MSIPAPARLILDFIRQTEVARSDRAGYDVIYGHNQAKLPKLFTAMTLDEVIAAGKRWSKRFGSSAAGGYQFMRATLIGLKKELALTGAEKMTPAFQDRLGFHLLKRRGYRQFIWGEINRVEFGKRLAQEWASFPVLSSCTGAHRKLKRGQSYYAGDGLNKALVKPAAIEQLLDRAKNLAGKPAESEEPVPAPTPRPEPQAPQAPAPAPGAPEKTDEAPKPKKLRWSARFWTWLTTGGAGGLVGMRELGLFELDWTFWLILSGLIVALALIGILTMPQVRQALSMRLVGIFSGIAALLAAAVWGGPADAHEALPTAAQPLGWSYPFACCSGIDCRMVSVRDVLEKAEGYVIAGTGEVLPYTDARLKDSPDGDFHWCSIDGRADTRTICLFVPPRGF